MIDHKTSTLFKTLLFCFLIVNCVSQSTKESISKDLLEYLRKQEKKGLHGSVLIAKGNDILIAEGFGMANKSKSAKNTPESIIPVGSVTKQFTATAIVLLESQGKLSTGDLVGNYFDNVPKDKAQISLHHLLTHTSGLIGSVGYDFEEISKADFLEKVWNSSLEDEVGNSFHYSNIGYSLLAMVIEKVSEMPYEEFMIEHIFKPANMMQTGYKSPEWKTENIANMYGENGQDNGNYISTQSFPTWHIKGNGGILSTVEDMYKWYNIIKKEKILPSSSWKKIFTAEKNNYGYGWDILKNGNLIQHNGASLAGVSSEFRWFKKDDVFIMILSNDIEWGLSVDNIRDKVAKIARK